PLDFSDDERVVFCFNEGQTTLERRGSFSSIVLVISNHAVRASDTARGELVVKPKSAPCAPVWAGTITMSYRRTEDLGVITMSSTTPVAFEFDDMAPQSTFTTTYRLRSGSYTYDWLGDYTNRTPACRTRESASGTMIPGGYLMGTPNGAYAVLTISTLFEPPTYYGSGIVLGRGTLTSNCNDNNNETTYDWTPTFNFFETAQDEVVSEDGRTLEGVHRIPEYGDGVYEYRWNLTRVDE
ncbi:MAG TPA: hypothetical protein VMS65_03025, partial [Polyangiaceae bacterium]|nr:hypothetical protein [Polyangiaceae bacterium]